MSEAAIAAGAQAGAPAKRSAAAASLLKRHEATKRAIELIELGARMQVLEDRVELPREMLLRLYREVQGKAPPKGMLPFSTDWFLEWQPSIHAALYCASRRDLRRSQGSPEGFDPMQSLAASYRGYLESAALCGMEPLLSVTRAWSLERFLAAKMLKESPCRRCGGVFVAAGHDFGRGMICGLCQMPPRAGKGAKKPAAGKGAD